MNRKTFNPLRESGRVQSDCKPALKYEYIVITHIVNSKKSILFTILYIWETINMYFYFAE